MSKLNFKGKIVQKIVGEEEPWFYSRQLLKDYSQYIKGKVIDVGGGGGKHKNFILTISNVESYTNLDILPSADKIADLNESLPIKDNSYDTAIFFSAIEYLREPQMALNEVGRTLRPGSYLLLTAPWLFQPPPIWLGLEYFRFSDKALKYMLGKAGFQIKQILPVGSKKLLLSIFLQNSFPILRKFRPFLDKWFSPPKKKTGEDVVYYFVIAKKL